VSFVLTLTPNIGESALLTLTSPLKPMGFYTSCVVATTSHKTNKGTNNKSQGQILL